MVEKKANPSPRRIIFYRDGVSEGQFKTVLETEVPRLKGIPLITHTISSADLATVSRLSEVGYEPYTQNHCDRCWKTPPRSLLPPTTTG